MKKCKQLNYILGGTIWGKFFDKIGPQIKLELKNTLYEKIATEVYKDTGELEHTIIKIIYMDSDDKA